MSRTTVTILLALVLLAAAPGLASAHCQVPCGIYDDAARIARMYEDAATIEKAMAQMAELAGNIEVQSANQLARWVATKEEHASNIISVVSEYFLTQKVKPVAAGQEGRDAYLAGLADHHAVMAAAMKTKQNTSLDYVAALRTALDALSVHYDTEHLHRQ
ncbi:superoxide dismutase, Ni [bacterium]|nr:superoxide dismutase, Ni [bacterium]MBU1072473.1 superoxide dismutase, Ni [bacterium]MBU1675996.1 superoxide dismutase, Ni [bacterium]